ncbi:MAG: dTDP-4-dehydrorhamnose reductase [Thermoanaerobaculales bacterium]
MAKTAGTSLLITGAHGQLGRALAAAAADRGLSFAGRDVDTLDIRDATAVHDWIAAARPAAVINCAAMTAVDDCESNEAEATSINGDAVGNLAAACTAVGARLVQISTDYVFSGDSDRPYSESDATAPLSAYGRSKRLGEELAGSSVSHLIVRTAWLYGHGGRSFVETIRAQIEGGARTLRVVADQRGCPTYCDHLAAAILNLVDAQAEGVVHAVNSGDTTWHGFAVEIARLLQAGVDIEPVSSPEFPRPAPRPAYSLLDTSRLTALLGRPMPHWRDALKTYLDRPCVS